MTSGASPLRGRIALKVDVDTCRGAQIGVPSLLDLLQEQQAKASFFFALGPDRSGRDARSGMPARFYDLPTRLTGCLVPAPDIGLRAAETLRQVRACGHEVAMHAWDRVRWERQVFDARNSWIETQMTLAWYRFEAVFGESPQAHAAAGWRMNRHALRLTQRLGLCYASDCRGTHPFFPVIEGEIVRCPQVPTTLPTLDERLSISAGSAEQAVEQILEVTSAVGGDHVFTLRAEIEGMRFREAFRKLLAGWRDLGWALVALRELVACRNLAQLPCHEIGLVEIPGRKRSCLVQGRRFLAPTQNGAALATPFIGPVLPETVSHDHR